jgi:hypothetical protein
MIYFVSTIYIMRFREVLHSEAGRIVVSILLGVGLASMFRKTCKDKSCYEFKGPSVHDVETSTYRFDNECYDFRAKAVPCNPTKVHVQFA